MKNLSIRRVCLLALPLMAVALNGQSRVAGISINNTPDGILLNPGNVVSYSNTGDPVQSTGKVWSTALGQDVPLQARSLADFGTLKVHSGIGYGFAAYSVGNGAPSGSLFASAGASWSDWLTINSEGLSGQVGHLTVGLSISDSVIGGFTPSRNGTPYVSSLSVSSQVNLNFTQYAPDSGIPTLSKFHDVAGTFQYAGAGGVLLPGNMSWDYAPPASGDHAFSIDFIYGSPFTMVVSLSSSVQITSNGLIEGSISADADAANSAYWRGITGVMDAAGNSVESWSVVSQSGTDYTKDFAATIPEPSTYATFFGVLAIGLALFRRARTLRCRTF